MIRRRRRLVMTSLRGAGNSEVGLYGDGEMS
jgi:hypothetical protein